MTSRGTTFNFENVDTSNLTHSLHPYPAKFPPQLPRTILKQYSRKGETVLDPFCGSGTTLVEARLQGINSIGIDVNGLSCLLSKVKATPLNFLQIKLMGQFISKIINESSKWKLGNRKKIKVKNVEGLNHWFQLNVAEELTFLINKIKELKDNDISDFLKIILSSIIVKVSNQESDTRFAAIRKNISDCYTFELFTIRAKEYSKRIEKFSSLLQQKSAMEIHNADSRNLFFIRPESIDLIITSPPYANTYDYYLYHKFRKRWLDLDVQFAQNNEIGSRREYSSLKENPEKWKNDLKICFEEMNRVLKCGGLAFIVIGDSIINKKLIKMDKVIDKISKGIGFEVCDIISSDLSQHSKIFNPRYAQKGKKEHLITLKKQ